MLSNMAVSLIKHKRIHTTLAKAKALKVFIEPLITKSKNDTTHSRRIVFSYLKDKEAVSALFREVSEKVASRPGGYTRILKTGNRLGDNAEMCFIELVDFNENMLEASQGKKSTRRRRSTKKKADEVPKTVEAKEAQTEEVVEEAAADVKSEEVVTEVKEEKVEEEEPAAEKEEEKSEPKAEESKAEKSDEEEKKEDK